MSEEQKDPTAEQRRQAADAAALEEGVPFPDPPGEEEEEPEDHDYPVEGS